MAARKQAPKAATPAVEFAPEADVEFVAEEAAPEVEHEPYYAGLFRACDPNWTPASPASQYEVRTNPDGRITSVEWANGRTR